MNAGSRKMKSKKPCDSKSRKDKYLTKIGRYKFFTLPTLTFYTLDTAVPNWYFLYKICYNKLNLNLGKYL